MLPEGDPPPLDGSLPESAQAEISQRSLGIYVHVPFCMTRCGYCDFNTYTAAELGSRPGASRTGYVHGVLAELDLAARVLGPDAPPVSTIFVGGDWYKHVSLIGRVQEIRRDPDLHDIDRLSQHYTGKPFGNRARDSWTAELEVHRWHGWDDTRDLTQP